MNRKIPYTGGGGSAPHSSAFRIKFKQDVDRYNIKAGDENEAYILRMVKLDGIMTYPPYGKPDYYLSFKTEEAVLDMFEFLDLPEYNNSPPPVDPGTDVILPY